LQIGGCDLCYDRGESVDPVIEQKTPHQAGFFIGRSMLFVADGTDAAILT
jgi:hypothetical protein